MSDACQILLESRPTAINLFWAVNRMQSIIKDHHNKDPRELAMILLEEAHKIKAEDI